MRFYSLLSFNSVAKMVPGVLRSLMILGVSLFTTSAFAQVNAEQVLAIGRNVLSMEDYMLAIQYFNQAIKSKPYLADAYYLRGIAKLSLDDYKGAEEDCTLALERNRFKTEAYKVRGYARQQMNLDSLAIEDYEKGLEYNPQDRQFLFYKAVAQTEIKRLESADSTFRFLRRLYPKFPEAITAHAHLKLVKGDTLEALEDIETSLKISPTQINPYLMRAEIYYNKEDWNSALRDMDEAVRIQPDSPDLYVNRAYIRYNNDDYFGAMADYNYAIDLKPDNVAALFNRGLLRFEVRELDNAAADFSKVLALDGDNFHARYNRALVFLKMNKSTRALPDLRVIAERYPRFYPVYYAMAQCAQEQGDMRGAVAYMNKADELVRRYVTDPGKNPLDRPTVDRRANKGSSNTEESDEEIMEKFNRLVTSSEAADTKLSFNDKIKGRVQDRNVHIDPEPAYALTMQKPSSSLTGVSNYFRALDDLNQNRYIPQTIYLVAGPSLTSEKEITETFRLVDSYSASMAEGTPRPIDLLARGILYTMLRNYDLSIADFSAVIASTPDLTAAYMGRGYAYMGKIVSSAMKSASEGNDELTQTLYSTDQLSMLAMADFDKALEQDPRLIYAWFNKGNIYFSLGDFTSAMQCYSKAIEINPEFGQAYYNRGLSYLKAGNRPLAFTDLSKAGELGVLPSYNLLKRMK